MKTKLGIAAGALAAIAYLTGFFGGYVALIVITGYVFIAEENDWLKVNVLKALVITLFFSVLSALIGFVPNIISLINSLFNIWGSNFSIAVVSNIVSFINSCLNIIEKVLILLLALFAANLKTIKIGFIDKMIEKIVIR